jgi:hypothetical protein
MVNRGHSNYYISRKAEMLEGFNGRARWWRTALSRRYGDDLAGTILRQAREEFEALIFTASWTFPSASWEGWA